MMGWAVLLVVFFKIFKRFLEALRGDQALRSFLFLNRKRIEEVFSSNHVDGWTDFFPITPRNCSPLRISRFYPTILSLIRQPSGDVVDLSYKLSVPLRLEVFFFTSPNLTRQDLSSLGSLRMLVF